MGSYSLLEEVWDKPLVENQDLLVNQRGPYENSGPIARNLKTTTSAQTYASVPHQYEPQISQVLTPSQTPIPRYTTAPFSGVTAAPRKSVQNTLSYENTPSEMTRSELDSKYIDRIRALEEQISRLESSFGAKAPSVVSEMMSNNDLLMYIATGAFFIFVMDNIAKMSKQ